MKYVFGAAAVALALTATPIALANESYPSEPLNYVIAFGPGGGNDLMSRTLVGILNQYDLYDRDISVENRDGGSGAVGFSYVKRQKGSPYFATSTSGNFLATPLVSNTDWTYADFTPVALLASDAMFLVVSSDSGIETVDQFVSAAKDGRVIVGGTGTAGPERVVASLFANAAGISFDYVPIGSGGELVTSLTSGSVSAIVANPSEVSGQIAAGNFRALAFSDAERSTVYPEIPTFREQGYDFDFSLPRGMVLPGGVDAEIQAWWVKTLQEVVKTPEWQDYLKTNSMSGNPIWGAAFGAYLKETSAEFETVLREIGATQ
ncbi:Bug family tripartite tricarboxylate transporter substrate binding protein [Denitrobaculum tricleocarpae]|uniref:Tripartite tricarboxylate transporter substrate binding protein n=1 Tax=Denitrobaculum tricleocarpae TaxID=2591009 RepID=A0A545TN42_9PROT|nr:tripartite tricarboxylate transporter substrate binding protein [Denitrobaculum tricleocarpae]TQV78571.1 tripartite tricarboxylate transporter substrate binding protein [Denitrobaculum tricleocarpae]